MGKTVILYFITSTHCRPCAAVKKSGVIEKLAEAIGAKLRTVDGMLEQRLASALHQGGVPALIIEVDGFKQYLPCAAGVTFEQLMARAKDILQ